MQFQVPQFIETEDKIVGPLTLRQFIYVGAAGGLSFMLYFFLQTWLWFIISVFVVGLGIAFAFVKVNGRPLVNVFLAALRFYWGPQKYVWQPENPNLPKTATTLRPLTSPGFSLESLLSGLALKNVWQNIQTGAGGEREKRLFGRTKERYQAFRRLSGERRVARRVDYR